MAEISDIRTRLAQFVTDTYSSVDVSEGTVLYELLVKIGAQIHQQAYTEFEAATQSSTIVAALENPKAVTTAMDNVSSNFFVTRKAGSSSQGTVKVLLSASAAVTIPSGELFLNTSLGVSYLTEKATYTLNSTTTPIYTDSARGFYYILVPVTASAVGAKYQITHGTELSLPTTTVLRNFVRASAYGNFTAAEDQETDGELIARIPTALTHKVLTTPAAITARFKEDFTGFVWQRTVGAKDAEEVRSSKKFPGVSSFGKADIYVKSALQPITEVYTATATSVEGEDYIWEVIIPNDALPGFYYVHSVILKSSADITTSFDIVSTEYGYSTTGFTQINELFDNADARFTKYQTATIRFEYINTVAPEVDITLVGMPYISEMQDLLLDEDNRLPAADYLIKAAVPCFITLNIVLRKNSATDTETSLNLRGLKDDILNYIQNLRGEDTLYASKIVEICHNYGIKSVDLPINIRAQLLGQDNSNTYLSATDAFAIPTISEKGISPKVCTYHCVDNVIGASGILGGIDIQLI